MVTLPCGSVNPSLLIPHTLFNSISQKQHSELNRAAEENDRRCSSVQAYPGLHPAHSVYMVLWLGRGHILLPKSIHFWIFIYILILTDTSGREHHPRSKLDPDVLLAGCLTCTSAAFLTNSLMVLACALSIMNHAYFSRAWITNPHFISFQILQLHFSEVHVCVWEGV